MNLRACLRQAISRDKWYQRIRYESSRLLAQRASAIEARSQSAPRLHFELVKHQPVKPVGRSDELLLTTPHLGLQRAPKHSSPKKSHACYAILNTFANGLPDRRYADQNRGTKLFDVALAVFHGKVRECFGVTITHLDATVNAEILECKLEDVGERQVSEH